MHLSTFAARQIEAGNWVIDATSSAGVVQQLAGVFSHKAGATRWIVDHPAASFMPSKIAFAEPEPIVIEPQDILSLQRTIESLQRENAWLKARLARDAK
jgi:hypothetical protein